MEKHKYDRDEDTGKLELDKVIKFLKDNGYKYIDVRPAEYCRYIVYGSVIADFEKEITYTDKIGNWINDRNIKISIEIDDDFDYKNISDDPDYEKVFDHSKANKFINDLLNETYDETNKN